MQQFTAKRLKKCNYFTISLTWIEGRGHLWLPNYISNAKLKPKFWGKQHHISQHINILLTIVYKIMNWMRNLHRNNSVLADFTLHCLSGYMINLKFLCFPRFGNSRYWRTSLMWFILLINQEKNNIFDIYVYTCAMRSYYTEVL